jgi:circadian clock protein KaiB
MNSLPQSHDPTTEAFEHALAQTGKERYVLRLYVTGNTNRSLCAIQAIKALCEQHLKGRYDLEIIDLLLHPEKAKTAQIIATPTLVKIVPLPLRRLIGDFTDHDQVLVALDLKPKQSQ